MGIEKLAIEIVSDSERAAGNEPRLLGQHEQHLEGCDLISTAKDGEAPKRIEVKGVMPAWVRVTPDGRHYAYMFQAASTDAYVVSGLK